MPIRRVVWAVMLLECCTGIFTTLAHYSGTARAQVIAPGDPITVHLHPTDDLTGIFTGVVFETYSLDFELIDRFTIFDDPSIVPSQFNFFWSPDGTKLAVLTYGLPIRPIDTLLQVWDIATAERLYEIPGIELSTGIAWSPDGSRFAARFQPNRGAKLIRTYDSLTGQMLVEIDTPIPVSQLAWSPGGNQLVFDGVRDIQVWSADTGQWLRTLNATMNSDAELAFSPSNNLIAFVNLDNDDSTIEIWNTDTGLRTRQLYGPTDRVIDFSWNAAGLLSTGADDTVRFWDVRTGQEMKTIHTGRYPRAELNAAGTILLIRDETFGLHTRDASTGELLAQFHTGSAVASFPVG